MYMSFAGIRGCFSSMPNEEQAARCEQRGRHRTDPARPGCYWAVKLGRRRGDAVTPAPHLADGLASSGATRAPLTGARTSRQGQSLMIG